MVNCAKCGHPITPGHWFDVRGEDIKIRCTLCENVGGRGDRICYTGSTKDIMREKLRREGPVERRA